MLTGERRWLSARRGGMTVLGKVTVPKPVNLPSQRLENHGLDPNVEIVPKGTLSWGSRSSSSAQNAWGSPALSPPKFDGVAGSPRHLSSRPSSGGSGTRPSTAGSDRSHEPVPNVWGPNSRPSSASGVLAPNQTSVAAARPRSAEPRPASSQLSRFAESISENSVAWGASGTTEKMGASSSKIDGFSLSSGDFPTLGSEKNTESHVRQGHSSQGRPASASSRAATPKQRSETFTCEDDSINASEERGAGNTSKNEYFDVGGGDSPNTDMWQRENKPYPDPNMPPQHFGPWHGPPPHNPPNGVWYRGPLGGPPHGPQGLPHGPQGLPHGPQGPPGSYPLEPFAYYHPRLPARPPGNLQQPVLRPGSTASGYLPENGDAYRPHRPDSYMQPVMQFGPGAYAVQMAYDGYYGPPRAGSCISNERKAPVMGMATAPCVYNRYPVQTVHSDPRNFHGPAGYDSPRAKEQGVSGNPRGAHQGPYKVLLKHQEGWEENDSKEKREHIVSTHLERENLPEMARREIDLGADCRNEEQVSFSKVSSVVGSSQSAGSRGGHSSIPIVLDLPENMSKAKRVDDSLVRKPETAPIPVETPQQFRSTKRNPTLIEKIESLNNKARISDGRYDAGHVPTREEKLKPSRIMNAKADDTLNEAGNSVSYSEKAAISGMLVTPTLEMSPRGDKRPEMLAFNGTVISRPAHEPQASAVLNSSSGGGITHPNTQKRPHGVQGRTDNRGKGRFSPPEGEAWRKKPLVTDLSATVPSKKVETCVDDHVPDHHATLGPCEKSNLNIQGKVGGDLHETSAFDPSDHMAQRAKMREIAAERAKQLQKEEEERTREQKARALAKLEELNRRTLAEISAEKFDHVPPQSAAPQPKQEISQFNASPMADANTSNEVANSASGWISDGDKNLYGHEEFTDLPKKVPLEAPICAQEDPVITNNLSLPMPQQVNITVVTDHKSAQVHDSVVPKQKQIGYKRKQMINKNSSDRSITSGNSGHPKLHANEVGDVNSSSVESKFSNNANNTDDSLLLHKKKNNRTGKNKHKLDEISTATSLPELVPADEISSKASVECSKLKTSESVLDVASVQATPVIENTEGQSSQFVALGTDQGWSLQIEEVRSVINNQLKPQPPRRMPRNTQGTRATEKFHGSDSVVWAPVRSLKKNEAFEDATFNSTIEAHTPLATGRAIHGNHKSRRAEMERYVPKPVAKELSQQGNSQQPPAPSVDQATSDGTTGKAECNSLTNELSEPDGSASGKGELAVVSKLGENKQNKLVKTHGLWRPRASGESPRVQPSLEGSCYSSGPSKTVEKSIEQHQPPKAETYLPKEQAYPDNWNAPESPISNEPVTGPTAKDHGVSGRGKRQPVKRHKGTGHIQSNSDHKDLHGQDTIESDSLSSSLNSNQLDGRVTIGENRGVDPHASSHWQPKSQVHLGHSQQGSRVNGGQRGSSRVGKAPKKEYPVQGGEHPPLRNDKDNSQLLVQPLTNESDEQKTVGAGTPNIDPKEARRERKGIDSPKKSPQFAEHPVNTAKPTPLENVNNQHEQSFSGSRRHGHHYGRFGRGHQVLHGGRNPGVQDNNSKQQNLPASSDRRRHDSHNEYQQARFYGNEPNESFEEGSRVTGSRYREKGQTHSRRGGTNVYARKNDTVRVAATYHSGEQRSDSVVSHS